MMYRLIFILIATILPGGLLAQQTIEADLSDIVQLEADSFDGDVQWQLSNDGMEFTDIVGANTGVYEAEISNLPTSFRARVLNESCDNHYSETIKVISSDETDGLLWSDPQTWGASGKPLSGQEVLIPSGTRVILDETPPELGGLVVEGVLVFDRKDLTLASKWIVVNGGILRIGTEEEPFEQKAILTINDTGTEASVMNMGTRGIMVMKGALELHGAIPEVVWTKIDGHGELGSKSLDLIEPAADWEEGDEIVIAPTDYYEAGNGISITQLVTLSSVDGSHIDISEGLNAFRWGLLQYATESGMSLTSAQMVEPPVADTETTTTPLILDERAEIGHMTRNIVIQAPEDDLWNIQGFGVHTMIMPNGTAHIEGVEFKRGGQRGRLRRYPFHWHMLSYAGTETLDDATGQYFRGNTINSSTNRGIVIHGTNGVSVEDNIVYDVRGHGIFTEDAVERRNVIDGNLVLHIRNPEWGAQLKEHETGELGSSAFWISNPDNTVTNNTAADSQTFGFWLTFPEQPWGLSQSVLHTDGLVLRPNRLLFGTFDNNTAHSNKNDGIHLDDVEVNNDGTTQPVQYWSTTDGRTDGFPFDALRRFTLSRYKTWKNQDNGAWDRGVWTDIIEVVSADNCGRFFAGSGADGVIERSLVVGTSLNYLMNGTGRPETADFQFHPSSAPTAFATYHSAFSMRNNVVVNFNVVEHDRAGVFATDDYYIRPVDKGQVRNTNNLLIESHPGVKLKAANDYFTLASALWDPEGHWGPAGNYFVYDDPFLTYGKTITTDNLGTEVVGGVSVPGPFYGFLSFVLHGDGYVPPQNKPFQDYMAIHVSRLDDNYNEVATWNVTSAQPEWALNHMRDFATTSEGIYELTFPDELISPTDFQMDVENMLETTDTQVIGIQFDSDISPVVFIQQESNLNNYVEYAELTSLNDVVQSDGETWWQDENGDRIWVKLRGGIWQSPSGNEADDDFEDVLNETLLLKIRAED
ncbi:MAG: G8 domain-containing protein [Reichenbachiella sp.]|uniref:G8 domain-containing protein n=1 Tax=Reichenbachiella sp. TaxID=2184521 RepID=UPI003264C930